MRRRSASSARRSSRVWFWFKSRRCMALLHRGRGREHNALSHPIEATGGAVIGTMVAHRFRTDRPQEHTTWNRPLRFSKPSTSAFCQSGKRGNLSLARVLVRFGYLRRPDGLNVVTTLRPFAWVLENRQARLDCKLRPSKLVRNPVRSTTLGRQL